MTYRQFNRPDFANGAHSTHDWVDWMADENVLHDFLPLPAGACNFCGGVCSPGYDICYDCPSMSHYLDALIPASYSLHNDLESLVGTYKNGPAADPRSTWWQSRPLGTLLAAVFSKHGPCIARALGPDPIFTWVPSDDETRGFDHIEDIIGGVQRFRGAFPWDGEVVRRNREVARPPRKHVRPASYEVLKPVDGRSVLLFDDLWTTGASMASVAAALKLEGASMVVGVVLGRQFKDNGYADAPAMFAEIAGRGWDFDACPLCAGS